MKTNIARVITLILAAFITMPATAQVEKPRLAIQDINATDAVKRQAREQGQLNVLEQILQGSDGLLMSAITQTRRFDIVARSDYRTILKEQAIGQSGDVNPADPQIARAFNMAGARYVATVTADNYQDIAQRTVLEGGFGSSPAERRTIQLQATIKIYDTTTGVLLNAATITIEDSSLNEILPGVEQQGRPTNALIGKITKSFATQSANRIMNVLVPAKVLAYTIGNITFNRGEGTGVEVGQYWQILFAGEELIDPDTGESLGSEEIPIGWAQVTSVLPKFSTAQAIQDFGIEKGAIMRLSPNGLPDGVNPDDKARGTATNTAGNTRANESATSPETTATTGETPERVTDTSTASGDEEPIRLALFIRDVSPEVPDAKVSVLEAYITSWLTNRQIEVINRAEVLNAVSAFSKAGANKGTGDPMKTMSERVLSDQSSAVGLSRLLGADGLVVATITSLVKDRREVRDPQRGNYDNIFYTLDVTWNVLDGGTGGSIASGIAQARDGIRNTENQTRTFNVDTLLRDDANQIGQQVRMAMAAPGTRRPSVSDDMVEVRFNIALADLSVPEITKQENGDYVIGANRYQLQPLTCTVKVDGVLAGSAPGPIMMTRGAHRVTIERPMLEPMEYFVNARPNMDPIPIPMALSVEGRARWMEQTRFFESLKDGAVLREAELEKAKALAEFLRNSRMTIDTSQLRTLNINTPTFWNQLIDNN
ncbi:MAG: CsgG/HfaB family protein [Phycisphaerales bacterium]|nr:CsgG/HfaB family protein [Phycisphaerales bacterium]